jgi:hypothetical protein
MIHRFLLNHSLLTKLREQVVPQPAGFYDGWVTSLVVGPFKGTQGSMAGSGFLISPQPIECRYEHQDSLESVSGR